jgi:head-tail adaptor
MLAGKLDRRVTLQRFTSTVAAGSGEQVKVWGTLGPGALSASHRRASARETLASAELAAASSDVFEIRYDSAWGDLSPLDRLVFEGVVHEIVGVAEIGRREGLRIDTVARAEVVA